MLVLGRRLNERIFIGKNQEIKIRILKSGKGQIRLGIEAPKEIPIFREEVIGKISNKKVVD